MHSADTALMPMEIPARFLKMYQNKSGALEFA